MWNILGSHRWADERVNPVRGRQLLQACLHRGFFADPLAICVEDRVQARRRQWRLMHAARNEACLWEGQRSLSSRTPADLNKPTAGHLCGRTSTRRTSPPGSCGTAPASFKGKTARRARGASLACTSAFAAAITTGLQTCGSKPVESSVKETENEPTRPGRQVRPWLSRTSLRPAIRSSRA